jgi:hypothetical protein
MKKEAVGIRNVIFFCWYFYESGKVLANGADIIYVQPLPKIYMLQFVSRSLSPV